ncbi:hypothetical protein BH24BAC1_BH24BAC1_01370 [soil metagenome]
MHFPSSPRTAFFLLLFPLLLWGLPIQAQSGDDAALAKEYLSKGDYEKASALYSRLITKDQQFERVYPDYLKTLLQVRNYKEAEKVVKKAIKRNANAPA